MSVGALLTTETYELKTEIKMNNNNAGKPVLDGYLQNVYLRARSRWVQWMSRHSQRLGRTWLLAAFGLFSATIATGCLLLIFSGGTLLGTSPSISPDRIITIRSPDTAKSDIAVRDTVLLQQLAAFKRYMAHLEKSEAGRKTIDSLLSVRPGLIDSIAWAESLYNKPN